MPLFFLAFPLVLILIITASYYFYRIAFYPKIYPADETLKLELDNGRLLDYAEIMTWEREEVHIRSPHGYELFGYFYPFDGSNRIIILSHGITISLYGSMKYMPIFRKHGFNVLIYDNRFHGRSGGNACSFGYYEKYDLKAVVDWVIDRCGPNALIGTHGESLGAAITLQHAAIDRRIAFAIADCPFSDLDQLFQVRLRAEYRLPPFPLIPLCGIIAKLLLRFNYRKSSPLDMIGSVMPPTLFIHGDQDKYIPTSMSVDLFEHKKQGYKALYLAPGAKHAESIVVDRIQYYAQIEGFLISTGVITPVSEA